MLKILLTDDHSITRLGLSLTLKEMYPDVQITEAYDEASAVHFLKRQSFNLMIFDINMPGSDSAHLLTVARELHPNMKTFVFSMCSEKTYAKYYLNHGADGFLNKDADNSIIKNAIEKILSGEKFIPESIQASYQVKKKSKEAETSQTALLSFRELEVLRRLLQGRSLTDIGTDMKLHVSTVSTYKIRIMQKLGVSSLLEIKDLPDFTS